jgi:hypothetical protein
MFVYMNIDFRVLIPSLGYATQLEKLLFWSRKPNCIAQTGLPDFSWCHIQNGKNIPNDRKIYQLPTKQAKWRVNKPNDHKI